MSWPTANIVSSHSGSGWQWPTNWYYGLQTSTSASGRYNLYTGSGNSVGSNHDMEFTINGSTITLNINPSTEGSANPNSFKIGTSSTAYTSHAVNSGDTITLCDATNGTIKAMSFVVPSNFPINSGPTVTSITVANEIASTRQFTVTHTGTLTASDICYTIDGVDITSLTSPNTPITNLQTTSTGSTFDSYTVSKFGTHSINIGEKYLNFLVANSTTNQDIFSSNYNITVNFPALSSGTYTDNLGTLVSGAAVDSVLYGSQRIKIKIEKDLILMYVWIYENYNSYQVGIQSFKVLIQQWDYGNLTGNTPAYISNAYYVKPDTLYESTGSPNTLLTFPTGMLVDTYNWNFATDNNVPVSTTTSNGGRKRRYPIISTNLFDRQKSIFSIGLTHKDETLF